MFDKNLVYVIYETDLIQDILYIDYEEMNLIVFLIQKIENNYITDLHRVDFFETVI